MTRFEDTLRERDECVEADGSRLILLDVDERDAIVDALAAARNVAAPAGSAETTRRRGLLAAALARLDAGVSE